MLTVYLLRHGQTPWNADNNRYCGRTDIPLTEKGVQQAHEVRRQLEGVQIDAVYSSPLQRALKTAEIASGQKVIADQRLIEVDFGEWEYKTREQFVAEDPETWQRWESDPLMAPAGRTGETGQQILSRVVDFFAEKLNEHKNGTILVAAHNGVNRLYLAHKLGMPLKNYRQLIQHNSAITRFTLDEENVLSLEYLNAKLK
ncbi:histidine phosphatase family protein [Paraflavitalea sp. CAU 1676]|uniref:histidine phosphatase family protein n=1 Tax=Paraflavitalea sp. CAU 1676 TaxID=3032598 RepID=UPI0023DA66B3|nr:histidine phosphatase family protein [Paraflavitalea sp. CAU 1676]MDF2191153.1 histidine phosphatase family protein [Paraflavitalea sp. CAU 1676]